MNNKLAELVESWTQCKKTEQMAVETRRKIEDEISSIVELNPQNEGTVLLDVDRYKVKIVSRLTRKVDSDLAYLPCKTKAAIKSRNSIWSKIIHLQFS